jgi:hypothetical protein
MEHHQPFLADTQRDADFVARATRLFCLGTVRFKEPVSVAIVEKLLIS